MIRALVVTHGDLGRELVRVTRLVAGPVEGLDHLSNQGLGAAELGRRVKEGLEAGGAAAQAVLLVDEYGGSCAAAARGACSGRPGLEILAGVNLAMLIGFATWRDSLSLPELARALVEKGRQAVQRVPPAAGG